MRRQLNLIPYLPFSWFPMKIEKDGAVFKATAHNKRTWFIPENSKNFAMWAFRFMETNERFLDVLTEGDVLAEVGACTGEYTIPAAQKIGTQGKVFAFEADPLGCECIKKNAQLHNLSNIEVINEAVSDTSGQKVSLSICENLSGGLLVKNGSASVVTTTLDECLIGVNVDVLKLTVNGHEPEVLAGAQKMLNPVRAVIFQSARHEELIPALTEQGFRVKESRRAKNSPENVKTVLLER